jgi:nucleotide-binding universal stress UspA family protein
MQLNNIVFPVDFSDRSYAAAPFIHSMARRYEATVSLVHVIPPVPPLYFETGAIYPIDFDGEAVASSFEIRLREFADEQFPHLKSDCTVLKGDPATTIVEFAQAAGADLIALPTHGYGVFRRAFLGSVTTKVLHDASIPVWTDAHCGEPSHRAHPQPRHIIAAVDLDADVKEETERTVQTALSLARDSGAVVEILHVAGEEQISSAFRQKAMAHAVARAAVSGTLLVEQEESEDSPLRASGESVASVVRRVALLKRADLVVIGRGRVHSNLFERMRSHAYSVICEAPCPVVSV